jgi:hypothetical protein
VRPTKAGKRAGERAAVQLRALEERIRAHVDTADLEGFRRVCAAVVRESR